MTPLSLLVLLAVAAAPALADLECESLYPRNFSGKHRAYLQLNTDLDVRAPQLAPYHSSAYASL